MKTYTEEFKKTIVELYENGNKNKSELVISAFKKAKIKRGITKGMIFHSDLGSQYTSNEYENLLQENNIKHSYSKKGYPYYNASMESFNAILKKEEVNVNTYETFISTSII